MYDYLSLKCCIIQHCYVYIFAHAGKFLIKGVKPNEEGESTKVKVKLRLNIHGIFFIKSATLIVKQVLHRYITYM